MKKMKLKYLFNFSLFIEKFDVKDTDSADVKLAKDKLNSTETNLSKFPEQKSKIDSIYKANKDKPESDIYKKAVEILGKNPESRNPLSVKYAEVSSLEAKIKKLSDTILADDTKAKLTSQNLDLISSPIVKAQMQKDLAQMKKNIELKKKELSDNSKIVDKSKQEVNQEMTKLRQELNNATKKLSEKDKK